MTTTVHLSFQLPDSDGESVHPISPRIPPTKPMASDDHTLGSPSSADCANTPSTVPSPPSGLELDTMTPRRRTFIVHTSVLFDPKLKAWLEDISIEVDPVGGSIVRVFTRPSHDADLAAGDIDLRGKVVLPGFVDSHTHIFLHAYS